MSAMPGTRVTISKVVRSRNPATAPAAGPWKTRCQKVSRK